VEVRPPAGAGSTGVGFPYLFLVLIFSKALLAKSWTHLSLSFKASVRYLIALSLVNIAQAILIPCHIK
jgi:hypothetical protein